MGTVLITTSSFGTHDLQPSASLHEAGHTVHANPFGRTLTEAEIGRLLKQHQPIGLIAGLEPLTASVLQEAAAYLKVISRCGAGLDNVDVEAARRCGMSVYATMEAPAQAVAELTVGFMLDLARGVTAADRTLRAGQWRKSAGFLLSELTIGIVGLGRIGKRVASLLRGFEAPLIGTDPSPGANAWATQHAVAMMALEEVLCRADIVSLHVPGASGRPPLIGERQLRLMKPDAFLINTARGGLVDEVALVEALNGGRLAGAAIDTFSHEPYDGPLRQAERAVLTPHIGSYARAARRRMEQEAVENLLQGLRG